MKITFIFHLYFPDISALPAKRIKVCTGAELKKICPPKLCDCPPYQPGISFIRAIVHMIGLVAKSLLAGGLVYLTYRSGMWGDNEQTEKLFLGLCKDLAPTLCGKNKTVKLSELCESEINLMCVVRSLRFHVEPNYLNIFIEYSRPHLHHLAAKRCPSIMRGRVMR